MEEFRCFSLIFQMDFCFYEEFSVFFDVLINNNVVMRIKRYQIWTVNGLEWSDWFISTSSLEDKWQLKNKQLNEYRTVTDEEWKLIKQEQKKRKEMLYNLKK